MRKKFLAIAMVTVTIASLLTGCGKSGNNPPKKDKFYIYSWNKEAGERVQTLLKLAGKEDLCDKIEVKNLNVNGGAPYMEKLDPILGDKENKEYPDMIALEADYIVKYTNDDITQSIDNFDITEDDTKNMYQSVLDTAKDKDGKVKGLSWQTCPGGIVYRKSMAKELLGTDDPAEVQEKFKDFETMKATADEIKQKSEGKVKLFSGYTDLFRIFNGNKAAGWVGDDKKLTIDPKLEEYMTTSKEYCDNEYVSKAADEQQWQAKWNENMANGTVFAQCSCTWFNQFTLFPQIGNADDPNNITLNDEKFKGDFAMIQGPVSYTWGGTWLAATDQCQNKDIATEIYKAICNKDVMQKLFSETSDFPNNKEAAAALVTEAEAGNVKADILELEFGDVATPLKYYAENAENAKLPELSAQDAPINDAYNKQIDALVNGKVADKDAAIAAFKEDIKTQYPDDIKVD